MENQPRSHRFLLHVVLGSIVLMLCLYLIFVVNQQTHPEFSTAIEDVKALYSNSPMLPSDDEDWKNTRLPDDWFRQSGGKRFKWYRFKLPLTKFTPAPWALYITNTIRPVSAFINNRLIFSPDQQPSSIVRWRDRPQLIKIDPGELYGQEFIVTLRMQSNQSDSGMLGSIYTGPETVLTDAFEKAHFIKVTLVRLLVFSMILSSFFVLLLWIFRRSDTVYAFYVLAVILWAIYSYSHIPMWIDLMDRYWELLRLLSLLWWPVIVGLFCNRFLNDIQSKIETVLLVLATVVSLFLLLLDTQTLFRVSDFILPSIAYLFGFYASYRMLTETWKRRDVNLIWLTLSGMLIMLLSFHDILILGHWIQPWSGLYLHYSSLLLIIVFNIILLKRYVGSFNEVERLNRTLEQRIEKKSQALDNNYKKIYQLERENDLASERERIMRDMHDGVGGSLVSMRAALERGDWSKNDVYDGLGNALDDLYLMIHSLDPYGTDLSVALGSIRHRLDNRLNRAGIKLLWVNNDSLKVNNLKPQIVLQIMRIMQESVTNVIKHSAANKVEILIQEQKNLRDQPAKICISITDNGCGINDLNHSSSGKGLPGMIYRAQQIGAEILIQKVNPGTKILFELMV